MGNSDDGCHWMSSDGASKSRCNEFPPIFRQRRCGVFRVHGVVVCLLGVWFIVKLIVLVVNFGGVIGIVMGAFLL
jgi:hypothetical protein